MIHHAILCAEKVKAQARVDAEFPSGEDKEDVLRNATRFINGKHKLYLKGHTGNEIRDS